MHCLQISHYSHFKARGESLLLRSKVEREMPSLKVTITPDETSQTTVLQGQTSRWKLKISNVGYAPASNIMLKTNAPWLNMTQSNESSTDENAPTSYCVGPSGTSNESSSLEYNSGQCIAAG